MQTSTAAQSSRAGLHRHEVRDTARTYVDLHDEAGGGDVEARKRDYMTMVNAYYDLATDFYEFGWGRSFHFAPRRAAESFKDSLARHERRLAQVLNLKPGMEVLDIGCGVGGPMQEIARFSGARVTGINNNAYQISRGEKHLQKARLGRLCRFEKADFMNLPFADGSIDAVYTIEASCHAPDKAALFREIFRTLKPGGGFAGYEWCLTDRYVADSAEHQMIKKGIEEGDGLPDIAYTHEVDAALKEAGFVDIEARDVAPESDPATPWYHPLASNELSIRSIPRTPVGRRIMRRSLGVLERVKVVPKGTLEVYHFLNKAADSLVAGGEQNIFTPMYFFHARKPA